MGKAQFTTPGLDSIPIYTQTYVDKVYGDDATGIVDRLDKPFRTIAAARAAVVAAFPVALPRKKIVVNGGVYNEQIELCSFIDFELNNCTIDTSGLAVPAITDGYNYANSEITGNAQIIGQSGIFLFAGSKLLIECDSIYTIAGTALDIRYGIIDLTCNWIFQDSDFNVMYTGDSSTATLQINGVQTINGIYSGIYSNGTTAVAFESLNANTTIKSINPIIIDDTGTAVIGFLNGNGTQRFYANMSGAYGLRNSSASGTQILYGNVTSTINTLIMASTGTQIVFGNLSCSVNFSTIIGTAAGIQTVTGNVYNEAGNCIDCSGGATITIYGNVTTNTGGGCVLVNTPGTLTINGDVTLLNNAAGIVVTGAIGAAAVLIINNSRISSPNAIGGIILFPGGGTTIIKGVTIVTALGSPSITGNPGETINVYGACEATQAIVGAFVQNVGAINVNALVV